MQVSEAVQMRREWRQPQREILDGNLPTMCCRVSC